MKELTIELTDKQCDKLVDLAEKEDITIDEDEQAEGFISGKMDLFLAAPDMYEVIEATLAISDLWTYPESASPENVREAQALSIMKRRLETALAEAKRE